MSPKKNMSVDELAVMVANGFAEMDIKVGSRFDRVEERLDNMEEVVEQVAKGQVILREDVEAGFAEVNLKIDRFTEAGELVRETLANHESRLVRLERK